MGRMGRWEKRENILHFICFQYSRQKKTKKWKSGIPMRTFMSEERLIMTEKCEYLLVIVSLTAQDYRGWIFIGKY